MMGKATSQGQRHGDCQHESVPSTVFVFCFPPCTHAEAKSQEGKVTCTRSHSKEEAELQLEPGWHLHSRRHGPELLLTHGTPCSRQLAERTAPAGLRECLLLSLHPHFPHPRFSC